jgi:hypothetical protein
MIEWENGEITTEPLSLIAEVNLIMCALYACHNNLLKLEGWQQSKSITNQELQFRYLVNKVKPQSYCHAYHVKWYGYLAKMKADVIRIWTGEPDYSALPDQEFYWERNVYGNVSEMLPSDTPRPLGKLLPPRSLQCIISSPFKATWHNPMMRISSISHGWEMLFVICYVFLFVG